MSKSDDEDFRRNRRRRQNREAASRCRQRRRDLSTNLLKEYQELRSTNTQLIHEIRVLDKHRQRLDDCLARHDSHSCPNGVNFRKGLPKFLPPADSAVNCFGESSSTTAGGSGSQLETWKTGVSPYYSVANGLSPSLQKSSTALSFAPADEWRRRDRSPRKWSSGIERGRCLTKGDEVDHRAAVPMSSEPRIIQDIEAIGSTAAANNLQLRFAFNEGDDEGLSGDSNFSTLSVGPWLKDA